MRSPLRIASTSLALIALTLVPRLIGIDLFATVDEPFWLTAGSNFYYALGQREFVKTIYDYHPAVTTMWIIAAAMLIYFPQYRGLGQGYFDVYKDNLEQFLLAQERTPLELLTAARIVQVAAIGSLLVLVYLLLRQLLDERTAVAGVLMLSFDPFFLGHSRLLNHEGVMTLFAIVSILSLLVHLFQEHGVGWLVVSGAATGLALLTKSSSIVVIAVAVILLLYAACFGRRSDGRSRLGRSLRDAAIWLGVMAATFFVLWPGMWVAPQAMLQEVFGNAMNYALAGARVSATGREPAIAAMPRIQDVGPFVQGMLWRTTPVAWLGLALCAAGPWRGDNRRRLVLIALAATGVLFVLLFALASGRNSAHYVMFAYAAMDILAGAGIVWAATWISGRLHPAAGEPIRSIIVAAAVTGQALCAAAYFPYYYNYYNPVMEAAEAGRQNPNFGYGEGLELAAAYLNQKPGAQDSSVMAFYGRGPFSYFFRGLTEPLKTVYAETENVPQLQQVLRKSDYLVIYYALQHGRNSPANLMLALEGSTPETTISVNGIEYIRVYALGDMPEGFYDKLWP